MTVNQLVVGSIPTAGAKFKNKINDLHYSCGHVGVQLKVINTYKHLLACNKRVKGTSIARKIAILFPPLL